MRAKVVVSLSELRALCAGLAFFFAVAPANADGIGASGFGQLGKHGLTAAAGPPPPPPSMFLPVMANIILPSSGTAAQYGGSNGNWPAGQMNSSATARQVPIPIGGILSGLNANLPAAQNTSPTPAAVVDSINAADGTVTCQFTAATAPFNCSDGTHSDAVNAGDLFAWHFTAGTGPWATAGAVAQISFLFQSNDTEGMMIGGLGGVAATTVSTYNGFGTGPINNTTEVIISSMMPVSGVVNSLYVIPNGGDNASGVTHSYILVKNGTNTGMTCANPTPATNPSAGCCVDVTTGHHIGGASGPACGSISTVAFAAGDTLSVLASCPGGNCSAVTPGISISYTPTAAGQAILTAYFTTAPSTSTYIGFYDRLGQINNQINYDIMPILSGGRVATFGNLMACGTTALTGANTRTVTSQFGTAVNVLPTNASGGPVATWGLGTACPGANSGVLIGGALDSTHTFNAGSGYSLDNAWTVSANGQAGNSKTSLTAVIH